jgi:hypothetical protein
MKTKYVKIYLGKNFNIFSFVAGKRERKKTKRKTTTFMQMKKILSQKRRKRKRRRLKKTKQRPEKMSRHQPRYLPILSAGSSLFLDSVKKNRSIICLYIKTSLNKQIFIYRRIFELIV